MADFRKASHEVVNVFEVDGQFLFKHYFDESAVFREIGEFYVNQDYRFEVPPDQFEEVRSFLAGHGYGLVVVDPIEPFVVVVRQYTAHPENIFKESVSHRSVDRFNFFLLRDQAAVDRVVAEGATPLSDTALENPF